MLLFAGIIFLLLRENITLTLIGLAPLLVLAGVTFYQGGAILSGGQRQLISLARALLADPRILILDEARSSADTQTERLIQTALEHLFEHRTVFVIAHRLSTITRAAKIVVIDRGRVVESGTHAALLEPRGRYFDLYTMVFAERA